MYIYSECLPRQSPVRQQIRHSPKIAIFCLGKSWEAMINQWNWNNWGALFSDKAIWKKEIMQHDQHDLQEVGSPKKPKDIETFHGLRPGNLEGTFVSCGFQNLDPIFHIFPPPKSIYMVYIPTSKQSQNN